MTIRTFRERLLVYDDRVAIDQARLRMTLITRHSRMAALKRKMRPFVVIKS